MALQNLIPVRAAQAVCRQVEDVMVILLPENGEVKVVNAVGARIFELVDGLTDVREIAAAIAGEYQVTAEQAETDTLAFLRELQDCRAVTLKVAGELPQSGE